MANDLAPSKLSPLQRVIYEVDQLDLPVRESIRIVTQRVGYFVGQQRYVEERRKMLQILEQFGDAALDVHNLNQKPLPTSPSVGSSS